MLNCLKLPYKFNREIIIFLLLLSISSYISVSHFLVWETSEEREIHNSFALFSGDEPSYLQIASTLTNHNSVHVDDFYLDPEKDSNLLFPDIYYEVDSCRLHHSLLSTDGHCYSSHQPGLAFLIFPGYAIGGVLGAMITINIIFSLNGILIYKFASKFSNPNISLVITLLFSLGTILLSFSNEIYPDFTTGVFLLLIFFIFFKSETNFFNIAIVGALLGFLPFLKTAYFVFPVILLPIMILILFNSKHRKEILVILTSFSIIFILYLSYLEIAIPASSETESGFGGTYNYLIQDQIARAFEAIEKIQKGLANLLFGRSYGLFVFSPIALVSLFGFKYLWKNNKGLTISIIVSTFMFILAHSLVIPYAAGWTAPSRYLLPILPLLSIPFAVLFGKFYHKISFHILIILTTYVGVSFNILFSRIIYGHSTVELRKEFVEIVYLGLAKTFPYIGNSGGQTANFVWYTSGMYFWIFLTLLLTSFLVLFLKDPIKTNLKLSSTRKIFTIFLIGLLIFSFIGLTYTPLQKSQTDLKVISIYDNNFSRLPETDEIEKWSNEVLNKNISLNNLEKAIINSPEGKMEKNIVEFYRDILNRNPDRDGVDYWKNKIINENFSIDWVRSQIINSPEAFDLQK